mmetsp:Transcript_21061/g.67853  ORF Transcript_21061/g.67853 Transcript_21061/m.67853 type:complete len:290 (-) Transcript_21061:170-1039(-)
MTCPETRFPVSGWSKTGGGGPHGTPRVLPSWYHWAFVVPRPMVPVVTSTSKRMDEWSVAAPARPARKTHERGKTSSLVDFFVVRCMFEAVMTRNVDKGALSGKRAAIWSSLSMTSWMIQSPPFSAFRKKWIPRPPSSFLCLMHSLDVSKTGDTGTPSLRPFSRKAHLFSMAYSCQPPSSDALPAMGFRVADECHAASREFMRHKLNQSRGARSCSRYASATEEEGLLFPLSPPSPPPRRECAAAAHKHIKGYPTNKNTTVAALLYANTLSGIPVPGIATFRKLSRTSSA